MRFFARFQSKTSSLLIRLLLGFIAVILLLVSFNFLSFTFFQRNIRNEIIGYNAQNIRFTSERYEEHLQLIQKQMYALYFNEDMTRLKYSGGNERFWLLNRIREEFMRVAINPLIYLDDVILVFNEENLTLSKTGTNDRKMMFEKFYASDSYPDSFWRQQFDEPYTSKVFPMATFYEHSFHESKKATAKGVFIPYMNKHWQNNEFYLVAMLDAHKLFNAFHRSVNTNFYMYDAAGMPLYSNGELGPIALPELPADKSHVMIDNTYYFYETGAFSGFTYVNVVPGASISEQISRLHVTLAVLLVLALLVSVIISVWFSIHFNKPVKQIMSSISKSDGKDGMFKSNIKEFEFIGQKLDDMKQTNAKIQSDLMHKNNQLASFGYLHKLKNIYNGSIANTNALSMNQCRFIVYQIFYKDRFWEEMKEEPGPLTYCIYEYMKHSIQKTFPDALTLQVESRQMLSVINGEADDDSLMAYIEELQQVLSIDADYYFLTIAVSPQYEQLTDFTEAYEQTVRLLQERSLNEHTQVVRKSANRSSLNMMTPAQEQQFDSNLAAGNAQELLHLLDRHLALMERKQATALQFQQFVVDIVAKVRKTLNGLQLDERAVESVVSGSNSTLGFYSVRHFRKFFNQLLVTACEEIQRNQRNGDPIVDFVIDYVEKHHAEDITLDIVAEHLHITGGYLSTYFKEKTGEYFVDYINGVRIRIAQRMLLETDLKIQDISLRSGYQNINSFNRMFKKFSGMSPREYRKEKLVEHDSA